MPIAFKCEKCGMEGNANDFFVGRKGKCRCGNILDFTDAVADPTLPLGRVDGDKVVDRRTGLDRRVENIPVEHDRRKPGDRRTKDRPS